MPRAMRYANAILEAGRDLGLVPVGAPRLRQQYAGIRMDSFAPAGGVYRRKDEEIPRVAAGRRATKVQDRSAEASSPRPLKTIT